SCSEPFKPFSSGAARSRHPACRSLLGHCPKKIVDVHVIDALFRVADAQSAAEMVCNLNTPCALVRRGSPLRGHPLLKDKLYWLVAGQTYHGIPVNGSFELNSDVWSCHPAVQIFGRLASVNAGLDDCLTDPELHQRCC